MRAVTGNIVGRLRDERGFSLVFSLLTVLVTTVTLTSVVQYTTANSRTANRSDADQIAYSLAEAGLNNGAAVLSKQGVSALDPTLLPGSEPADSDPTYTRKYDGGTSKWWGVLVGHQWLMHGRGIVTDPAGGPTVSRHVTSTIKIQPTLSQELNSNSFNYMFAKSTTAADGCDVTLRNSVVVDTSLFILGGLCFENSASIQKAAAPDLTSLVVGETIQFKGTGSVGASGAGIAEAHVVGGCRIGSSGAYTNPCTSATRVWADAIDSNTVVNDGGPTADFAFWYANAKPGPGEFCTTGYSTGTPSTRFEAAGSTTMSPAAGPYSAGTFNLTPATDYTCRYYDVPPAQNDLLGELSWNAATKRLSVKGVVFIDGSATVANNAVNQYVGQGTLYLAGTFVISGTSQLCGGVAGGVCDFASWDPNSAMLGLITNGHDASNYGVRLLNSARFQGSVYATYDVELQNTTQFDGPIVANSFSLGNSVMVHEFPTINSVPIGWPGNPTVYAEPQPPSSYSG